jgi:ribosomal protein S27AE
MPEVWVRRRRSECPRSRFHDLSLKVEVVENPEAWISKGVHESILTSTICGKCGFVELYAKNPAELLKAYRQKQQPV